MSTKKLFLFICSVFFIGSALLAQDYEYIGAKKCKMCHNKVEKGESIING